MNPYRQGSLFKTVATDRAWWPIRLWRRWRYRRCVTGEHMPELDVKGLWKIFLRCTVCGATRETESYGPLAVRAIGEWSAQ